MDPVVKHNRPLTLGEMESIARDATREALTGYRQTTNREHLTLGSELTDTQGLFELYIAGERPTDAQVISRAKVDRFSGEVDVEVFLDRL
jgi:hypothetical protein